MGKATHVGNEPDGNAPIQRVHTFPSLFDLIKDVDAPAIALTGHRPPKLGGYDMSNPLAMGVRRRLRDLILSVSEKDAVQFVGGCAQGADTLWADEVLALGRALHLAMPYPSFGSNWPTPARVALRNQMAWAAVTYVSNDPEPESPRYIYAQLLQKRNIWMVDHCNVLVVVWDGSPGGTANTVHYAEQQGKPVFRVPIAM